MIEWISVKKRLPTENGQYVVFLSKGRTEYKKDQEGFKLIRWRRSTAPRNKDRIVGHWGNCSTWVYKRITHWMPLYIPLEEE